MGRGVTMRTNKHVVPSRSRASIAQHKETLIRIDDFLLYALAMRDVIVIYNISELERMY